MTKGDTIKIGCAAIRCSNGETVVGKRHDDCLFVIAKLGIDYYDREEGFLTIDRRFVSREEAAKIAFKAGQIKDDTKELYSEDLY